MPVLGRFAPATAHAELPSRSRSRSSRGSTSSLGELAPKGIALQRPEGTALWIARPLHLFYIALRWPIAGLNAVGNAVLRMIGLPPATEHHRAHSAEELRLLVNASGRAGPVERSRKRGSLDGRSPSAISTPARLMTAADRDPGGSGDAPGWTTC